MFSLIISIIAIALVAALALASIYYGGSAFKEGSTDAEASTVINQGQQIQGAVTLADVDEKWESTSTEAVLIAAGNDYMKEIPSVRGVKWTILGSDGYAKVTVENGDICAAIEEEFGGAASTALGQNAFGCLTTGTAPNEVHTAYYNL